MTLDSYKHKHNHQQRKIKDWKIRLSPWRQQRQIRTKEDEPEPRKLQIL